MVTLVGDLGRDPVTRETKVGSVTNFTLRTRDGEYSQWHRVVAWQSLAEIVSGSKEGDRFSIRGRLQTRKWVNKQGVNQYTTEVIAEAIAPEMKEVKKPAKKTAPVKEASSEPAFTEDDIPF